MEKQAPFPLIIAAFFAIYVIWGSTYLLNKIAVQELPPFTLAALRFTTAGILVLGIAALLGKKMAIRPKQFWNCALAGFLFLSYGNGVVVWGLKYVDSNFAALEISAQPLIVLLMLWVLKGQKLRPMSVVGVVLGGVGIFLLVSQDTITRHPQAWIGILLIFTAMLAWAYGSIFVGKADLPANFFVNTGYQMLIGGLLLWLMSLGAGEEWHAPAEWSEATFWALGLLIVFGSIIAFTSFNFLLKSVSPEKVATNTYVNPIVAMFLGWYFLDEPITAQSVLAAGILLTGVYFINTKKRTISLRRFRPQLKNRE